MHQKKGMSFGLFLFLCEFTYHVQITKNTDIKMVFIFIKRVIDNS